MVVCSALERHTYRYLSGPGACLVGGQCDSTHGPSSLPRVCRDMPKTTALGGRSGGIRWYVSIAYEEKLSVLTSKVVSARNQCRRSRGPARSGAAGAAQPAAGPAPAGPCAAPRRAAALAAMSRRQNGTSWTMYLTNRRRGSRRSRCGPFEAGLSHPRRGLGGFARDHAEGPPGGEEPLVREAVGRRLVHQAFLLGAAKGTKDDARLAFLQRRGDGRPWPPGLGRTPGAGRRAPWPGPGTGPP